MQQPSESIVLGPSHCESSPNTSRHMHAEGRKVCRYANALMAKDKGAELRLATAFSNGQSAVLPSYQGQRNRQQRPPRPDMREQMALSMQLTERLPQRYCIQNHLGVSCWYWTPTTGPHVAMSKHELPPGQSQQMKCEPYRTQVIMEQAEGGRVRAAPKRDIPPRSNCLKPRNQVNSSCTFSEGTFSMKILFLPTTACTSLP